MPFVVGTAGHIDHGKTTLLRALTGMDADRLPEERRRGMTIDVGYAHLDRGDGEVIDFVDVPGHDGLVGNMLVGAGEIDAAMLVVAADDGPRAQTLEHLGLLDALGIDRGLAVVTKSDVVDASRVAEVIGSVVELLERTTLSGVPVLAVSSVTGDGLEAVREALVALGAVVRTAGNESSISTPAPAAQTARTARARLAIDRVFSVRGRGAVVTGTLRGSIATGDSVRVLPDGHPARVRGLQRRNRDAAVSDGGRTALNLAGVEVDRLARGQVVVADDVPAATGLRVVPTTRLLVSLGPPVTWPGHRPAVEPRVGETLRLHLGTGQADARVRSAGPDPSVRLLLLDRPVASAAGDRFVLRRPAPESTAAAGRVLDPDPPRGPGRRRITPERVAGLAEALRDEDPAAIAVARLDLHGAVVGDGRVALAGDVRSALDAVALGGVAAEAGPIHSTDGSGVGGRAIDDLRRDLALGARRAVALGAEQAAGVADEVLRSLVDRGLLVRDGDRVRDPSAAAGPSPELAAAMDRLEGLLAVVTPPPLAEAARQVGCPDAGIRLLTTSKRITRLEADLAWATATYHRLAATALAMAGRGPLTPAAYRDATGSSRRYALAILEDLDRRGILRRTPDGHVPGPRAPRR